MTLIIDASIGVKWLVPEEDSDIAAELLDRPQLQVPALFFSEVGNALIKKSRRGEIMIEGVAQSFADLPRLVTLRAEQAVMPRAFEIALALKHSLYDCVYLALAETLDVQLVTADRKFVAKLLGSEHEHRLLLLQNG